MTTTTTATAGRIARIVRRIVETTCYEPGDDWSLDGQDRVRRCFAAAEDGADGSTHGEVIEGYRDTARELFARRSHPVERIEAAVCQHFDAIEVWHEQNGSLDTEIG